VSTTNRSHAKAFFTSAKLNFIKGAEKMSGRMIITLTGGIALLIRFINRLLGFFVIFTGLWFWLLTYGTYKSIITYDLRLRFSAWADFEMVVCIVAAAVSAGIFAYNCYKYYKRMPDNFLKRLILMFFKRDYRPEREGNNVPAAMQSNTKREKSGFFFGVKWLGLFPKKFYVAKREDEDGHILVVGGSGMGKSAAIAKNALETWRAPIVAIDIKQGGELSAYSERLKREGVVNRHFIVFDPTNPNSRKYDPYYLLHHGGAENLVQNAREIALIIVPLSLSAREPFWIEAAQNILQAAILYYFDLGLSFTETMVTILTMPPDKLIDEIYESDNLTAKMCINTLRELELKTLAGIATELSNRIMVFATDPLIRAALCDSRTEKHYFHWGHVSDYLTVAGKVNNTSVFLRIPEDKLEQWASLTALMVNQLFRTLERRADKGAGSEKVRPVLILLDEAARLGKIDTIKNALATLRSKSVTICLLIQSLAQLDEIYGRDARRTIIDNCTYKAILGATDADSQEYFSRLVGTCEVEKESHGIQYDADEGIETGRGSNWSKHREPIIFPEEFAKLKDAVLITPDGFCRVDKVYAPRPDDPFPKEEKAVPEVKASSTRLEQMIFGKVKTPDDLTKAIIAAIFGGMVLTAIILLLIVPALVG
jgi:type IV secretion system protein VirD4